MFLYKKLVLLFLILNLFFNLFAETKNWFKEKTKAEKLYNAGKYEEAIILFREIILNADNEAVKNESYFWLALAYMDSNKLDLAEKNLEYYLNNFKTGLNYPEAVYQKGRLLFLQEQYMNAVEQLNSFKKKYPFHKLVSNSLYWIGESLYALGQFDDAQFYFNVVLTKYPDSIKREASMYKLRLIEHKKSELALQNLLKWSQEQYITALNQFRVREKTLQEALDKYGKSDFTTTTSDTKDIEKLKAENTELKNKISQMEKEMQLLKGNANNQALIDKLEQLEIKEKLLNTKEETLRLLEEELRNKEKSLGQKK